jgi:flagellar hook-associated protein 2
MAVGSVGSGLDINSLVQQLVKAERSQADARLDRTDRRLKAEISAVGTLRSSFGSLRTALSTLSSAQAAPARKVTLPEEAGFSATAAANASPGTYGIEVRSLATAHKLSSAGHASADSAVGTGRLDISAGDTSFSIELAVPDNSLAALRDAINAKAAGKGLTATLVTADDGVHLVLAALDTGTSRAIRVTPSADGGSLAAFAFDPGGTRVMTELTAARDAVVAIDGMPRTSASNTVTDAISGVSLTLTRDEPGTQRELKVSLDTAAQKNAVSGLVNAFNGAVGALATATAYNSSTGVAAALNGDAMARAAARDLRELVSSNVADFKAAGISINKDGTLKFDGATFDTAVAKDPALADRLFGSGTGSFASRLKSSLDGLLDSDGALASRSESLDRRTRTLTRQRDDLDARMKSVENRYRAQFIGLDSLMTKLQSSMNFLSQQLGF